MTDDEDRTDAADLGLDRRGNDDAVLFRWLVACLLFGARISQERAAAAFAELEQLGRDVVERYDGRLSALPEGARSTKEVSERLQGFKGVGPVAADIFLRDAPAAWHP